MKILFFARLFYPYIGGVEKHVLEISKILRKKGHKIIVVTEQYEKNLPLVQSYEGVLIYRMPVGSDNWFKKFRIWKWLWQNRSLISNSNVIHCHDVFFWYLPFRFIFPNKKVFTTFHGYESYPISKKAIVQRKIAEILSAGNICIGDFIKKWYGTKADYVIYGGVSIAKSQKSKVKSQNNSSKIKIILIGRLEDDIGIETYLEVLRILKTNRVNVLFEAFGDGVLRKEVQEYGKVHGFVSDLTSSIKKADVIFTSSYLTILESLANKKPVIAVYDNDLKKDYLLISPFKKYIYIENSVSKITEMLTSKVFNTKKIEEGYSWVQNQTWESIVDTYLNLWKI